MNQTQNQTLFSAKGRVLCIATLLLASLGSLNVVRVSEAAPESSADDGVKVEVSEISNYQFNSDFTWGKQTDGEFMLGNFKGEDVFKGELAKKYADTVEVRIRLKSAKVIDSYLSYNGARISLPLEERQERILLRRPEWNRGPDCQPRRQLYTYTEKRGKRVRTCQVVLIIPKNCPARISSVVCM